jgi:hypothetical protein
MKHSLNLRYLIGTLGYRISVGNFRWLKIISDTAP